MCQLHFWSVRISTMATITKPSDASSVDSSTDSALVTASPSEGGNAIFQKLKQLLASYKSALRNSPLRTKALTSLVIGLLGELLGAYLRRRKFLATYKFANPASAPRLVDFKRLGIFGFYGLAITGPFFHWWYGSLEKFVRSQNIEGNGAQVATKILLDRLVMTPPFLLFTLFYMQGMLTMQPKQTVEGVKRAYPTALALNWKVWTVAQFVNFQYVPLDYRVLFGNGVAFWWNCYLSLIN